MALRRPHKSMKMVVRRAGFFHRSPVVLPLPMPAPAGTPRYEMPGLWLGAANWHGGFCHAHPDPSGGQAPALHFLIPPSTIGLQFGRFRRWRAGREVDWRAHPGSESGMCFRTNRPCRLVPAHQGVKMRPGRWRCLGVVGAALPLWIPAFARMTRWGGGRPARVCRAPPRASRESPLQ